MGQSSTDLALSSADLALSSPDLTQISTDLPLATTIPLIATAAGAADVLAAATDDNTAATSSADDLNETSGSDSESRLVDCKCFTSLFRYQYFLDSWHLYKSQFPSHINLLDLGRYWGQLEKFCGLKFYRKKYVPECGFFLYKFI